MTFELHIRTLVFILGITHLMQVLVFYHQFRVNKSFRGVGWWLLWSAAEAVGFIFILFRDIPAMVELVIIIQNTLIVAGTVFIYVGVKQFFNKKPDLRIIIPVVTVFFAGLVYFIFIDNNIQIRSFIINITFTIIAFLTAYSLFVDKTQSVAASANFNAAVFMVHGSLFAYRAIMILGGTNIDNFLTPSVFNYIPFVDALVVSLLWTFGFIIMLNNRLNVEMAEAREQLQNIFNTSPDAAVITRLHDGLIADINDGYTAITGYTRQELSGKSTLAINIWKHPDERNQVVRMIKEQGHCYNYEATFIRKDGLEITGLMSAKLIQLQGIPHVISITRDITDRKRVEAQITLTNSELRKLNSEKDKFFSILAHDLKSPFNAFLGYTQLMAEDLPSMTIEQISKIAVSMRKSATNLYQLLDNLLEWSRMQRGIIGFDPVIFQVKPVVIKCLEPMMDSVEKKGINLDVDIPGELQVFADIHMFETILRNLVSNAVKYTLIGGKIAISAQNRENKGMEFSVSDTGIGMGSEMISRIFHLDATTNRPGTAGEPSTGLGLIICRDFIEKHGGRIWVNSEEGKGSDFYFTLKPAPHEK